MKKATFENAINKLLKVFSNSSQNIDYQTDLPIGKISKNIKSFKEYLELDALFNENLIVKCVEAFVLEYIIEMCSDKPHGLEDALDLLLSYPHSELINEIKRRLNSYVDSTLFNTFSVHDLNYISLKNYESAVCKGHFVILPESQTIDLKVAFHSSAKDSGLTLKTPLNEDSLKILRKALELTDENCYLVCQKIKENTIIVRGLATKDSTVPFPTVSINSKMWWVLSAYGKDLESKNGLYCLQQKQELQIVSKELSLKLGKDDPETIENFLEHIQKKAHGGLLIFANNCEHIKDLCSKKRGILINATEPITLEKANIDLLTTFCKIDGALIFDYSTQELVAIGTILDGVATVEGNLGRGSRYNSSVIFVNWLSKAFKDKKICAVIISEDGYVNLICPNSQ